MLRAFGALGARHIKIGTPRKPALALTRFMKRSKGLKLRIILIINEAQMTVRFKPLLAALFLFIAMALTAAAAQDSAVGIRFENHRFTPQALTVPAGQPLTIKVVNASKETIEFESFKLNREVAMTPGETITVHLPALHPGSYDFYDDFHQDVPEGSIVAK